MTQNNRRCDYCGCSHTDRSLNEDPVVVTLGMPDRTVHHGWWCSLPHYTRWCENYRLRTAKDENGRSLNIEVNDPGEMVISPVRASW